MITCSGLAHVCRLHKLGLRRHLFRHRQCLPVLRWCNHWRTFLRNRSTPPRPQVRANDIVRADICAALISHRSRPSVSYRIAAQRRCASAAMDSDSGELCAVNHGWRHQASTHHAACIRELLATQHACLFVRYLRGWCSSTPRLGTSPGDQCTTSNNAPRRAGRAPVTPRASHYTLARIRPCCHCHRHQLFLLLLNDSNGNTFIAHTTNTTVTSSSSVLSLSPSIRKRHVLRG